MTTESPTTKLRRFSVALSFPGEKRDFIHEVADCLAAKLGKDRVLYDDYLTPELARPNLDLYLGKLYREESELLVPFYCADYDRKKWCQLEWRQMRDILFQVEEDRIMPFRFDDSPITGVLSIDGYVKIGNRTPQDVATLILQRIDFVVAEEDRIIDDSLTEPHLPVVITVLLPDDHRTFGVEKADHLRAILAQEAGVTLDQIAILRTRAGSTKVEVQISEEVAKKLLAKYTTGQGLLKDRGVLSMEGLGRKLVSVRRLNTAPWALVGRDEELSRLDRVAEEGQVRVLTLVAWGGVGKTSLVAAWLSHLATRDWGRFERVFDWSFYSQGTREQGAASGDSFIAAALEFFGDKEMAAGATSSWDKGHRLAKMIALKPTLLILDGLEPLQHPPGPFAGALKDPAVATLLKVLAQKNPGLCIVTSREPLTELAPFRKTTAPEWQLEHLSIQAGVELLRALNVHGSSAEFQRVVEVVGGHALTLELLGRYLADAHGGDIRGFDRLEFENANSVSQVSYAFKTIGAYTRWLSEAGEDGKRQLAALELLGLFDRPADVGCLEALRREPAIDGLTEPLVGVSEESWNVALSALASSHLVSIQFDDSTIDAHPIIRQYFADQLREGNPSAWRAAHQRLYDYLKDSAEYQPDTLEGLQPLYQAVAHGCQAQLFQEAFDEVYVGRILRGYENFSQSKLGAFATDLEAISCFFERPWSKPAETLTKAAQAWILNAAALCLRALGRLTEAAEPMRAGLEAAISLKNWRGATVAASNLNNLAVTVGDLSTAVRDAELSVSLADRSGDEFRRMHTRVTFADALHHAGRRAEALESFQKAEELQAEYQPNYPLLYSLQGFKYCDLLLASAERTAWKIILQLEVQSSELESAANSCRLVEQRATGSLSIPEHNMFLLDIGLDRVTLGRASLYASVLNSSVTTSRKSVIGNLKAAVGALRRAGQQNELPNGLLSRAWLRSLTGEQTGPESAQTDLDEAWEIAERGPMKLFMADIRLYRARLFHDVKPYPWNKNPDGTERGPKDDLKDARKLIEQCGYWRRKEELEDAEAAAKNW